MKPRIFIRSLLSYIPGFLDKYKKGTGGSNSARYCYSVWMRHLVKLHENGMKKIPNSLAEIGPGDSLGIGLCSMLSGVNNYYAFDIIEHADVAGNLEIFDELIDLFKEKARIPDDKEFPRVKPKLTNYDFPHNILSNEHLKYLTCDGRLNNIRNAINGFNSESISINYVVPWHNVPQSKHQFIELIISQAVMEHIDDISNSYKQMYKWLKSDGYMSHQIDFSSHETHKNCFGHWKYGELTWKFIMHGRSYYINRFPNSYHIKMLQKNGFKIVHQLPFYKEKAKSINRSLNKRFNFVSEDHKIASNLIISKKGKY